MSGAAPGQAAPGDVLASLPRQWDAEADATAHWGDVSAPERAAYASGLRDCASELRKVLAAQEQPAPASASQARRHEAQAADRLAAAEAKLRETAAGNIALRSGIAGLAADLDRSAAETRYALESETQRETAIALRRLLETP